MTPMPHLPWSYSVQASKFSPLSSSFFWGGRGYGICPLVFEPSARRPWPTAVIGRRAFVLPETYEREKDGRPSGCTSLECGKKFQSQPAASEARRLLSLFLSPSPFFSFFLWSASDISLCRGPMGTRYEVCCEQTCSPRNLDPAKLFSTGP